MGLIASRVSLDDRRVLNSRRPRAGSDTRATGHRPHRPLPAVRPTAGLSVISAPARPSHGDDGFPLGRLLTDVPDRLTGLAQREGSVNHRRELAGFDQLLEDNQVRSPWPGQEPAQPLAHEQ